MIPLLFSLDINGNWGDWSAFGACSATCNDGLMQRSRNCDNPRQEGSGADCMGDATEMVTCNEGDCIEGIFS